MQLSATDLVAFEPGDGHAVFRLTGEHTLAGGVERIRAAIAQARAQRLSKLMIVITDTTGYDVPSLSMRLVMMRSWADAADGLVRAVIVCRSEFIDPHKFGIMMAANFGMTANVFDNEAEAVAWLRELA